MVDVRLEVRGMREEQRRMEATVRALHGAPMLNAIRDAVMMVSRTAKQLVPVDSGRLRASITPQVGVRGHTVEGVVGSNVDYAPYMELGTGIFVGRPPYFPPPSALETWARRHGLPNGYVVARAIYRRGGTRGRMFLYNGFMQNMSRIVTRIDRAVQQAVDQ